MNDDDDDDDDDKNILYSTRYQNRQTVRQIKVIKSCIHSP